MSLFFRYRLLFVLVVMAPLSGCLFHSRKVERKMSTAPLKTATQADLINYINEQAKKVQSMQATVDIDTSVGGEQKGTVTDYKQIRGYVLARKPLMLRMIGLMPIVRNKAFDMVSNGQNFKVWIPPKNRFVEGRNDYISPNKQPSLENLRPQAIYEAILIPEIDSKNGEIAVMQSDYEQVLDAKRRPVMQPDYEIIVVKNGEKGAYLARKIIFGRTDLVPHQQLIYDQNGTLQTKVQYADYKDHNEIKFPAKIEIQRPQEEYDITLSIIKLELNQQMPDDKFALEQPPGAQVVRLDKENSQLNSPPSGQNNPQQLVTDEFMMNKMIVANLTHRPLRSLISILAIALEVTLILLIVGLSMGMLNDSRKRQEGIGADVVVAPPGSSAMVGITGAPAPIRVADIIAKLPHVVSVAPVLMQLSTAGNVELVYGIDLKSYDSITGGFRYLEGGPFQGPDDVLVDDIYARSNRVKAGDKIEC